MEQIITGIVGLLVGLVLGFYGAKWQHQNKIREMGLQSKLNLLTSIQSSSLDRAIKAIGDANELVSVIDTIYNRSMFIVDELIKEYLTNSRWFYFYVGNREVKFVPDTKVIYKQDKK